MILHPGPGRQRSAASDPSTVCTGALARQPRLPLLVVIRAFAPVQVLVHFRFFLHIGFRHWREDVLRILSPPFC